MRVLNAIRGVRAIGPRLALLSLRYSAWRDWIDARFLKAPAAARPVPPGVLENVVPARSGARFEFTNAALEVLFAGPQVVRLSWEPGEPPLPYAVSSPEWPEVEVRLEEEADGWAVSGAGLRVVVGTGGEVRVLDGAGRLVRETAPPLREGERWTDRLLLHPEESVYGLGERAGRLDLRGGAYRCWNREPVGYRPGDDPLYLGIPSGLFVRPGASCLVFWDNPSEAGFSFPREGRGEARFAAGMLRSYVMVGPPAQALERFTDLTGRAPLPPRWALGYHQSRWGYRSQEEILSVAARFRELDLPLDALHLDIDYMDGYRVFTSDPARFPDLGELAEALHAAGVRLVTLLDPGVKTDPAFPVFREGSEKGVFCRLPDGTPARGVAWPGEVVFPDFTDPRARDWWGENYRRLTERGVDGFWHDMNEPACIGAWGDSTLPLATRHAMEGRGGSHPDAHNLYALLMNRAAHEGLLRLRPERRPWLLSRSGWAGLQRYAWTWTGDSDTSWEALRTTIATVIGLGLSGIPFSGPDTGGFSGAPTPELYLRWLQMAAFMPFFRTHSAAGVPPREPWAFGEPTLSIAREALKLRRRLLPYLYTLAREASRTGSPLVRPLFWPDASDPELLRVDDAFFLGDALLVAPVLEPGAATRKVRLPAGEWFSFWDDREPFRLESTAGVEVAVSPERIPVFVRSGSVLPMDEDGSVRLHFYGLDEGEGVFYTDEGDGCGAWRVDHFTVRREGDRLDLTVRSEGGYPAPATPPEVVRHPPGQGV